MEQKASNMKWRITLEPLWAEDPLTGEKMLDNDCFVLPIKPTAFAVAAEKAEGLKIHPDEERILQTLTTPEKQATKKQ